MYIYRNVCTHTQTYPMQKLFEIRNSNCLVTFTFTQGLRSVLKPERSKNQAAPARVCNHRRTGVRHRCPHLAQGLLPTRNSPSCRQQKCRGSRSSPQSPGAQPRRRSYCRVPKPLNPKPYTLDPKPLNKPSPQHLSTRAPDTDVSW